MVLVLVADYCPRDMFTLDVTELKFRESTMAGDSTLREQYIIQDCVQEYLRDNSAWFVEWGHPLFACLPVQD